MLKVLLITLITTISWASQAAETTQPGQPIQTEDSTFVSVFKWSADHIVNGFDSQDFLVLGFKPSVEYQKESFKSSWSNTKQVAKEVAKEYTREGTVATDIRNISFKDIKFHKLDQFTTEYFKSAFTLPATADALKMYPAAIDYVSDMFEVETPSSTGMKIVHGTWIVTQAGAFLLVAMPVITAASVATFVGEIAWNVVSRTFIAVFQGLIAVVDLFQYPIQVLKAPWAVLKSILFQGFSVGVTALMWTWDVVQTGVLATIEVGFITGMGIITLGAVAGIAIYKSLRAIFYDAPRYVLGFRQNQYYFDPLTSIRYFTIQSCHSSQLTPESENEMLLYRESLKEAYGTDDKAFAKMSQLSLTSQKLVINRTLLLEHLSIDNAWMNRVYLDGDNLYLYDPAQDLGLRIGKLVIESGQYQVFANFKYRNARIKKVLKILTSYKSTEQVVQLFQTALARYEWIMQNSPADYDLFTEKHINAYLNSLRKEKEVNPEKELAFPYAGLVSDICLFARAYRGLIDQPKALASSFQ